MKLQTPFIKLPFRFDVARLQQEVAAFPEEAWVRHPNNLDGNSALRLITVGGGENDDVAGPMAMTPHLKASPYLQQVLAHFGVVWSRSRLMRLGPGATVPMHTDINYHWHHRVRLHIPVVTRPEVSFHCDDQVVHMAEGDAWIFDNWRPHKVENRSDVTRIHLVADTTGNSRFWDMAHAAASQDLPVQSIPFQPSARVGIATEQHNVYRVMPPSEVDDLLRDLVEESVSLKPGDAGAADMQALQRVFYGFRQDWRQLWSLFADSDRGVPHYRKRLEMLLQQVQALGDDLRVRSNQMPVLRVVGQRIGTYAVNPGVAGMGAAAAPAAAQARPVVRTPDYDRPVIIVAAPRSGSTALFETLAVTPQLTNPGGEAHWLVEGFQMFRPGAPGIDSNRLTADRLTPEIALAMKSRLAEKLVGPDGERVDAATVRLLEKTPKNALRIPFFNALFPDARFVFLWREPEENVSSILDAWRAGGWVTYPQLPGWDGPWSMLLPPGWQALKGKPVPEVAAFQWATTNRIIMDDLEQIPAERRHVVRYSDFVADPAAVVRGVCAFAGIEFDAALSERTGGDLPPSRHTLTPPEAGKWRKNAAEIEPLIPDLQPVVERLRAFS